MDKRLSLFLAPVVVACTLAASQMQAQDAATADTVVATVNGEVITAGHLALLRAQLPQEFQSLPDSALFDGLLDQAIQQALLAQQVEEMGRAAELALENDARAMRANIEIQRLLSAAVTPEALQAAYDVRFAEAAPATEYNAAHILVESEDEALALKAELDGGADFSELARQKSTGPSGPNGGDLGWFGVGMMVPEFEEAVIALEPGQVSDPVQTQFGWHVIKLVETRLQDTPPLSEVEGELVEQIQQDVIALRLEELETASEVSRAEPGTIAADFLSDPSFLDQ
ncbi:peptidylprolyl isomerase [Pseudoruegeria sp. SK021]|uniref:peptidylprolyl isomerase n=1 Tax=Pseudoruegeria sp. SK021 TaxID=1933035 RepID=UPI000A2464D3|nr:peptidylprolyl isomerase [Pseudoruegeria sp. SK021]OSP54646.1 peptidylprolyl isomerase [Pseudoruegeria sp. SK021]